MQETTGEVSVIIQAPSQTVYEYLVDLTRHSEWVANLSKVWQVSPGQIGVGTVFKAQETAPPLPTARKLQMMFFFIAGLISGTKPNSEAEITALEPGKRIAWRAGLRKGDGWFNQAQWELLLESQAESTRVTQRFHYMPQTATAERMVGAAGEGGIEQACDVSLQQLKRVLEARVAQPV
jgi:uncharacterized membrane protein